MLAATQLYGAGLSPDSAGYIRAARALLNGEGIPAGYVSWPPLYPVMLTLGALITGQPDPLDAAAGYGAFTHALVVLAAAWLLVRQRLRSRALAAFGVAAVAFCEPLFAVSVMAWSEATFLALVFLTLGCLDRVQDSGSRRDLLLAGLGAGLAFLTRYIGFTLLLTGGLSLLFLGKGRFPERFRRAAAFCALGLAPSGAWLVRNWIVAGSPTGPRTPLAGHFTDQLALAVTHTLSWMPLRLALVAAAGGTLLSLLRAPGREASEPARSISPLLLFSVIYLICLAVLASQIQFDPITERLTVPATVALFVYALAWCDRLIEALAARSALLAAAGAGSLGLVLTLGPALDDYARTQDARRQGVAGYNTRYWREHPLIAYLRQNPPAASAIESNAPDALELLLGIHAEMTPRRPSGNGGTDAESLRGSWPARDGTLVAWFAAAEWRHYLYDLRQLSAVSGMQLVQQFPDAALLRVSPAPNAPSRIEPDAEIH